MKKTTLIIAVLYTVLMTVFAAMSGAESGGLVANLPNAAPWLFSWVALVVAWKQPKNGGILYVILAIASVFFFHTYREPAPFLIITLPLLVLGGLFLRIATVHKMDHSHEGMAGEEM